MNTANLDRFTDNTMNGYNNNQQYQQLNQLNQINQLSYIDDYQSKYQPPFYSSDYPDNNLKLNDDLQRLQVEDNSLPELKHWSDVVYECNEIQLFPENIAGGSDFGQFFYFIDSGDVIDGYTRDIILEIDGVKISGYTRNDVLNLIKKQQYHFIKAVSSSSSFGLTIDLKEFLSKRFVRASIDHELQSIIRDNIYMRTVPFSTRAPKPNEVDGVDYKFVTKEEFLEMDRSGLLLESGMFRGNYYGTPLPLSNPIKNYTEFLLSDSNDKSITNGNSNDMNSICKSSSKEPLQSNDQVSKNQHTQLSAMALKRRRNRSNITAIDQSGLPNGWEMIRDDHVHGVYYIDHVNKRTQYERPYEVELTKGTSGFGFTLSYLNSGLVVIKSIIENGPAALSGVILPGDFLASVSNVSVNGLNHNDIAKLFSTFELGDRVKLTFARSLQMPIELVDAKNNGNEYDLIQIDIFKGNNGFGFTITDSTIGQKVKKILDVKRCGHLRQGDLLAFVNDIDLKNLNHIEVVEILKNHCQIGEKICFTVKRNKDQQSNPDSDNLDKEDKVIKTPLNELDDLIPRTQSIYDVQNENLIAELKANLVMNDNNLKNNGNNDPNPINSTSANLLTNNYSNLDQLDQTDLNDSTNFYNVLDQNNQTNLMSSTMIMDNQSASEDEYEYFRAFLTRNATNFSFGFRIVGGREENRPVTIGSIVIGGVAHMDGILKAGDELLHINDQNVMNASHHYVVQLMADSGPSVSLLVRRRKDSDAFDVVLTRDPSDNLEFGFVIISCGNCCLIGNILDNSPAARCGRMKVKDKIVAVNGVDITQMNHPDIVNMIKASELTLKLRIIPADCYAVELVRGESSFGFSIRGGLEFNMPLFILRVAPNGAACDLLNVGDELIEINSQPTAGMTHHQAVQLISSSGPQVRMKLRRRDMLSNPLSTTTSMNNFNAVLNEPYAYYE